MFSSSFRAAVPLIAMVLTAGLSQDAAAQVQYASGSQPPQAQQVSAPGHYPQLQAPLYPSPVQYTPAWNGGTIITNQALAPHEMLYPHSYHAMYGPYYYRVKGGWIWTPFGVRQHEQVTLEGTEVIVKYKSHYPLFSGFRPPR